MIYVSRNAATIYQLFTITFIWSVLVSNDNSTEMKVYDRIYENELASWNMSVSYPTLYDMVLTSAYELYLIDYSMNQLIHYSSSLKEQCTIN
jgi:hypothetical protein